MIYRSIEGIWGHFVIICWPNKITFMLNQVVLRLKKSLQGPLETDQVNLGPKEVFYWRKEIFGGPNEVI